MLKDKTPIEIYHWLLRTNALSGNGLVEVCDFFEKEKTKDNLNIDEKEILASCILNITLAAAGRDRMDVVEEKRKSIRDFYYANYDEVAEGTRDYIKNYEEKMNYQKEMFKSLHKYVDDNYSIQKKLKK